MRTETHEIVSATCGLFRSEYPDIEIHERFDFDFRSQRSNLRRWNVYNRGPEKILTIDCFVWVDNIGETGYTFEKGKLDMPYKTVSYVYESLQNFLSAVFLKFPKIEKACEPFFEAAKKF
jgi:hypothetical protein